MSTFNNNNNNNNNQELTVTGDNSRRNYRGIFISILVLIIISSLIAASIFLANPDVLKFSKLFQIKEKILLEEVLFELTPKYWQVQWLRPLNHQYQSAPSPSEPEVLFFVDQNREIKLLKLPNLTIGASSQVLPGKESYKQQQIVNRLPNNNGLQLNFSTLVSQSSLLMSQEYFNHKLSPSRRYILASSDITKIYRYTFTAKFHIYDVEHDKFIPIEFHSDGHKTPSESLSDTTTINNNYHSFGGPPTEKNGKFQYVTWVRSSNRLDQDGMILVHNNDIYYKSSITAKETRLTRTGQSGVIYNGIPDWLYEEEILSQDNAIELSPSGSRIAYMQFNDSGVDTVPIPFYGSVDEPIPQLSSIRYPKAGRVNPTVNVYVVDLSSESLTSILVQLPNDLKNEQHYIGSMNWLSDDKLSLTWLNRHQNISYLLVCRQSDQANDNSWSCIKNLLIESVSGWLDVFEKVFPYNDEYYFAMLPKYESDNVGFFKHIAKISIQTGRYSFITSGMREVTEIIGLDFLKKRLYYVSTQQFKPDVRHIYWARIDDNNSSTGDSISEGESCITCNLYEEECQYNSIKLSPMGRYYIFSCFGPGVPKQQLRSIDEFELKSPLETESNHSAVVVSSTPPSTVRRQNFNNASTNDYSADDQISLHEHITDKTLVWAIEENLDLREKLKLKAMPQVKRLFVPVGENGQYNASVLMLLPPKIKDDDDQSTQYPMVVDVYAGPGSQHVDQRYQLNYGHYLASNKKIIYAMIDGRGSGYQGSNMLHEIYKRFGSVEIQDQISVTKHLVGLLPFINKHKVAIWGWSYGGYAAAMALAQGSMPQLGQQPITSNKSSYSVAPHLHPHEVFECAISVAPVTNWLYYDTAYTERYMSSPYKNEQYDRQLSGDHHRAKSQSTTSTRNNPPDLIRLTVTNKFKKQPISKDVDSQHGYHYQTTIKTNNDNSNNNISSSLLSSDLNDRYRKASLLDFAGHIDRKRFLLVHGTADDNVHFQQSIMLMKLLTKMNILYETQLYPDENHAINHEAPRLHLFSTMNDFFGECFDIAQAYDNLSYRILNHKH